MFVPTAWGDVAINATNFPDPAFREFVKQYDIGERKVEGSSLRLGENDGILSGLELSWVTGMLAPGESLIGVQNFNALKDLGCHGGLTELDVSYLSNLELLNCDNNRLKTLNLPSNSSLYHLHCLNNQLENLNVSNNPELKDLECENNPLGQLDVRQNQLLEVLCCSSTDLRELDVSKNLNLTRLQCWGNHLAELDLSKNKALTTVLLGVQEISGLKVKATLEGYEVCLKDYVSNLENIDISKVGANDFKARLLSYDGLTGNVVFDECPKVLHYAYRTHSPNNDLLYVDVKATMNVDVIERGGPTDNIICGISDNSYLDATDSPIREDSIAGYSAKQYGKKGFVADGNSRLIVRVQTQRPGRVTFSVNENIGVEVESLRNRTKLTASTPVHTSSIGRDGYQASAVLVAPEMYPSGNFPSRDFTVHVKFTADDTGDEIPAEEREIEEDITLKIHAAPVVLIHGFTGKASAWNTFGIQENVGIYAALKKAGFMIRWWDYDGKIGPTDLFSGGKSGLFTAIQGAFAELLRDGIVCTKTDLIGYSMGGLVARKFCLPETANDYNYYTSRSYRQGMVRRIIDVAVPNRGSPWANYILGDHSVLGQADPGFGRLLQRIAGWLRPFVKNAFDATDSAWRDMAIGSSIVTGAFPVNVPMYSIYGQTRDDLQYLGDNLQAMLGVFGFWKNAGKYAGKSMASIQEFVKDMNTLEKLDDGLTIADGAVTGYSNLLPVNPWVTWFFQAGTLAVSVWASPAAALGVAGLQLLLEIPNVINQVLFLNEDHDLCVSASSAQGDFIGHSEGMHGLFKFNHMVICKQPDTGSLIVELLQGEKSSFKVFTSLTSSNAAVPKANAVNNVKAAPEVYIIQDSEGNDIAFDPNNLYLQRLTLTVEPTTLTIADTGRIRFTAKCDEPLEGYVYLLLQDGEFDRILPVLSKDARTFEGIVEFTSHDTGAMKVYCFAGGNDNNLYTSNTVDFVVRAGLSNTEIDELRFSAKDGIVFTDADSSTPAGLYVKASDGSMFDVSSPAMGTVWTSSNPAIAYVNEDGLIHAQADGTATLTAEYAGLSASIIVNVGNELYAPKILTTELDNGTPDRDYTCQLQASGTPLIHWRIIDGKLPYGIELSSSGTISGKTNEAGTFSFTVEASNIAGSTSRDLSITVNDELLNQSNFPDPAFWNFVVSTYDYNKDGAVSLAEISGVTGFDVSGLGISSLKGIEYFTALEYLMCDNNNLTELDLAANTNLLDLACNYNQISTLDLSNNNKLKGFWCMGNDLTSLNVSGCTALEKIGIHKNSLQYLDVTTCTALTELHCGDNQLITLKLGSKANLTQLHLYQNQLSTLDVTGCPALQELNIDGNNLTFLDLSNSAELVLLNCWGNNFVALDISACTKLEPANFMHNDTVIIIREKGEVFILNESNIPDPVFWNVIVKNCDYNKDGIITIAELSSITALDVSGLGISSLKGIEHFTALEYLTCDNNNLTELDVSANTNLLGLACSYNQISTLDLSNNKKLKGFWCTESGLTSLNISGCTALEHLDIHKNSLHYLDVTGCTALTEMDIGMNNITFIDLKNCSKLVKLYCYSGKLATLDITGCPALQELNIDGNNLTFLDLSNSAELVALNC